MYKIFCHSILSKSSKFTYISPRGNYRRLFNLEKSIRNINSKPLDSNDLIISASNPKVKIYLDRIANTYLKDETLTNVIDPKALNHLFYQRANIMENIKNLEELYKDDADMRKLACEEEKVYIQELYQVDETLLDVIVSNLDREHCNNVIFEILAGVGGQEASLFAKDLFHMYLGYLNYLKYEHQVIELDKTDQGGVKSACLIVEGIRCYEKLKYEGGVHRVQRTPETERSGRIHTSTATVVIFPEPTDIEIVIRDKDLKVETKKSSGPGGQSVNTTDSAIRITHLPSGIVVNCQMERSQIQNRKIAMKKLKSLLYQQQLTAQTTTTTELRKQQKGTSMRNEKIRTYNYNQDRVTDHRLKNATFHDLKVFMEGGESLEQLQKEISKLVREEIFVNLINKEV